MATVFTLGPAGATIDLADTAKYAVLAEGIAPRPTRKRTVVPVSGRDQVRLVYSQAETLELPILLGVTGTTHDAFIANWRDVVEQLRLAREYALDGLGSPVLFTYQWATATAATVFEVVDGDFPPPPRLTNPVVATGQFYDALLTLLCQPYGRDETATTESNQTLTNDAAAGWALTAVGGDAPAPARVRLRNRTGSNTMDLVRVATRSRGNPANFLFQVLPGALSPTGYSVTYQNGALGGTTLSPITVTLTSRAQGLGAATTTYNVGFYSGGTWYTVGTHSPTAFTTISTSNVSTDPRTTAPWTLANINAYEWGVRWQSGAICYLTQFYVTVTQDAGVSRDLVVATDQTNTLIATANGSVNAWTVYAGGMSEANEYQAIDDPAGAPDDLTTAITSNTANQISVYAFPDVTAISTGDTGVIAGTVAQGTICYITLTDNLSDQYGAFRVMVRTRGTTGEELQLRWGGRTGEGVTNAKVALAVTTTPATDVQIVDLGRMNIPEQDPAPGVDVASFRFSLWRGAGTSALYIDSIELWPTENYIEFENHVGTVGTGPGLNEYAVVDALGRASSVYIADSAGNRSHTIAHAGTAPVLAVGSSRLFVRMSRTRQQDLRADLVGADVTYYQRYELQQGAG